METHEISLADNFTRDIDAALRQHHPPRTYIRRAIVVYHYQQRKYVRLKSSSGRFLAMLDRETCDELVLPEGSLHDEEFLGRLLAEKRLRRTLCFRTDVGMTAALARAGLLESLAIRTPVQRRTRGKSPRSSRRASLR